MVLVLNVVLLRLISYCCAVLLSLLIFTFDFHLMEFESFQILEYVPAFLDVYLLFPIVYLDFVFQPPPHLPL